MTPDSPRSIPPDVARDLTDISGCVEGVAMRNGYDTDLNILAHAIRNLVVIIEKLHGDN
jgi:hypothetical protein